MEINDCDQDCINTVGGYDCMCFDGYSLDTSNETCEGMFSLKNNLCLYMRIWVIITIAKNNIIIYLTMGKLITFSIPEDQGRTQEELIGLMKMAHKF